MGPLWITAALLLLSVSLSAVQSKVYIVRMKESPVVHYDGSLEGYASTAGTIIGRKIDSTSLEVQSYVSYLENTHDDTLKSIFPAGDYVKLYSYSFTVNGFAVDLTNEQAYRVSAHEKVAHIEPDISVKTLTTYTPDYLGLPNGAWPQIGGVSSAGEDIVIGVVDTGINPTHPSFANDDSKPYGPLTSYKGSCEEAKEFPKGSCNNKLIGARHFSAGAEAIGFNKTTDFASPLDGDGHGTHTASTAAGNHGVPVVVEGIGYGNASGMAPRARIAVYKCLYRYIGGSLSDVVAGIDQAISDGVDVLSLSVGPSQPPPLNAVYFNIFDVAVLGAVKAGVFVAQAAGNQGPGRESILSWSPWIVSVAAGSTDRNFSNSITLGNNKTLPASGLSVGTSGTELFKVVFASDVNITYNQPADECLNSSIYDKVKVEGNLLVCTINQDFYFAFTVAAETASNLSAVGVIFVASDTATTIDFSQKLLTKGVPAVVLQGTALEEFMKYYNESAKAATAKLNGQSKAFYTGAPPTVASFSSRGPDFNNLSFAPSDVLKPNIMAPGLKIWAAWSPIGVDESAFVGENFALLSGTSMSTPHIAGIAALIKQKNPTFSPAAIHSALAGTAFSTDKHGKPLQAMQPSANPELPIGPATAFDLGAGHVDPNAALDPGLVFEAGFEDYVKFLCLTPTVNSSEVRNATGKECDGARSGYTSDLNSPYIAIGNLEEFRVVPRTVMNVGPKQEVYSVKVNSPANVTSTVDPKSFTIAPGSTQDLSFTFVAKISSNTSSFGSVQLQGSLGHNISIPITIALARSK